MPKGIHDKDLPYLDYGKSCMTTQSALNVKSNPNYYYLPQVGDELVYYTSGHKEYLVKYPDPFRSSLMGNRMGLVSKRKEFDCIPCRVLTIDYEFPHSVYKDNTTQCVVQLGSLVNHTNKFFYVLYRPGHDKGEFLIPRLQFQTMFAWKWSLNQIASVTYDGGASYNGTIKSIKRDEEYDYPCWNGVVVHFGLETETLNEWELEAAIPPPVVESTTSITTSSASSSSSSSSSLSTSVASGDNHAITPILQEQQQQQPQQDEQPLQQAEMKTTEEELMDVDPATVETKIEQPDVGASLRHGESTAAFITDAVGNQSVAMTVDKIDGVGGGESAGFESLQTKKEKEHEEEYMPDDRSAADGSQSESGDGVNDSFEAELYQERRTSSRTCVLESSLKQQQQQTIQSSSNIVTSFPSARGSRGTEKASGPMPTAAEYIEENENRIRDVNIRLSKIAARMMSKQEYVDFFHPVSQEVYPNYCKFICVCISLSLMQERAANFYYRQPQAFLGDARTIYVNSILFNTEHTFIGNRAACLYRDILRELTLEFQNDDFGDYTVFEACLAEKESVESLIVSCKPLDWSNQVSSSTSAPIFSALA